MHEYQQQKLLQQHEQQQQQQQQRLPLSARSAPDDGPSQWRHEAPFTSRSTPPLQPPVQPRPRPRTLAEMASGMAVRQPEPEPEPESAELSERELIYEQELQQLEAEEEERQVGRARGGVVPLLGHTQDTSVPSIIVAGKIGGQALQGPRRRGPVPSTRHPLPNKALYAALQPHTRGEHVRHKYSSKPTPGALREVNGWGENMEMQVLRRKPAH